MACAAGGSPFVDDYDLGALVQVLAGGVQRVDTCIPRPDDTQVATLRGHLLDHWRYVLIAHRSPPADVNRRLDGQTVTSKRPKMARFCDSQLLPFARR